VQQRGLVNCRATVKDADVYIHSQLIGSSAHWPRIVFNVARQQQQGSSE